MSQIIPYFLVYYSFINCQKECKIGQDKMVPVFLKSKSLFYRRLITQNLKNRAVLPVTALLLLSIGIILQVLDPIVLVLLIIMYVSNCALQYSTYYRYLKYLLYLVPLILFMIDRTDFVYFVTGVIAVINIFFLFTFKLQLYQSDIFGLELLELKNKKVLLAFSGIIVFIFVILLLNYYNKQIPIEEVITLGLVFLSAMLEVDLSGNKMLVTKVKSRFNLIRIKSTIVNFNFLIPKQKNQLLILLTSAFLATLALGVVRNNYFTSFLLFIGSVMFFLYTIDYIVQCLLLERSVVYDNVVVKKMIDGFFSFIMFTYLIAFIAGKYIGNMNTIDDDFKNEYLAILAKSQLGYVFLYVAFSIFFFHRLYKSFAVNGTAAMRQRE